jgi:hypothetical protein
MIIVDTTGIFCPFLVVNSLIYQQKRATMVNRWIDYFFYITMNNSG